ncbi:MAG: protein kinase [Propionibacteriaceae bacterium]|nr:protein kinase [Propionibacteriaceae bacterium]
MSDSTHTPPVLSGLSYICKIGEGGYADVYLYHQDSPDRQVAVKVMRGVNLSKAATEQFQAEANAMARLEHPNIVPVHWAGMTDDGRPYIVMMYYPRENLDLRTRHERLSVPEVLRIGIQIGSAVETAHRFGLLHCDIKPANILVDRYGNPGLSDFGIAAKMSDLDSQWGVSVPWAPPELLNGRASASARSEVYSLGATLWHLLMGHYPYKAPEGGDTPDALMERILRTPAPTLTRADVPASLEALIRMSMSRNPAIRPATMLNFVHSLQDIERELHLPRTTIVVAQPDTASTGVDNAVRPDNFRTPQPEATVARSPSTPHALPQKDRTTTPEPQAETPEISVSAEATISRPPKPPQLPPPTDQTNPPQAETPAASVATEAERPRPASHRPRLLVILIGVLVLAVIVGGGVWLLTTRHHPTPTPSVPTAALPDPSAILSASPGTVLAVGDDQEGLRGLGSDGSSVDQFTITVVPGLTDVTSVAAYNAAYAIRSDGSLWSWGNNDTNQLGRSGDPSTPAPVDLDNVKAVAAGQYNAYALTQDGQVWGWGQDIVSNGATVSSPTPVQTGLPSMSQMVGGYLATYALTTDGNVWGWGDDGVAVPTPQAIPGFSNITQIASDGWGAVLGLRDDDTVWLAEDEGDGSPAQANQVDGLTNTTQLAMAYGYYALEGDGTVWCWGSPDDLAWGACGTEKPTTDMADPFPLSGLTGVHRIAASSGMAFAWTDAGMMAWGTGWISDLIHPDVILSQPTLLPDLQSISQVFEQEDTVTFFVVGSG